jgi:hypothetical protein
VDPKLVNHLHNETSNILACMGTFHLAASQYKRLELHVHGMELAAEAEKGLVVARRPEIKD